jgi:hypothetical protein
MQTGANIELLCNRKPQRHSRIAPEGALFLGRDFWEEAWQQHNPDLSSVHFPYHINPDLSSGKWHYLNDNC